MATCGERGTEDWWVHPWVTRIDDDVNAFGPGECFDRGLIGCVEYMRGRGGNVCSPRGIDIRNREIFDDAALLDAAGDRAANRSCTQEQHSHGYTRRHASVSTERSTPSMKSN